MSSALYTAELAATRGAGIAVYVSHPIPHQPAQSDFIDSLHRVLMTRGLMPCTISAVDSLQTSLLATIRSRIVESSGLIVVAFRKMWVERGMIRGDSQDAGLSAVEISRSWLTSPAG